MTLLKSINTGKSASGGDPGADVRSAVFARLRHPTVATLGIAVLVGLAGFAPPLGTPTLSDAPTFAVAHNATVAGAEDLEGFLYIRRWGMPAEFVSKKEDESDPGLNPELRKLGFIGITTSESETAVRLTHPEDGFVRLVRGDALPDGRVIVSVTANALTLMDQSGQRETLLLFPRQSATDAGDGAEEQE